MGEKLVQDAVRFHEKKISGASFSIPVCVGAQGMAVHGKYAKTTMPDGVPCFCAGEDDGTNGASGRFLNQLGFPGPLDTPEPYTRNGDSDMPLDIGRPLASNPKIMKMMGVSKKQFEEMSDKMDEEARKQAEHPTVELSCPSRQTLQCFREDKKEGKTTETCSVRRFGGGWSVTVDVPNQVQECVRNIPRDDALGGIPTVLLGNDGCPVRDRAGNFVPMDLRGYENYDWQSKSWH